MNGVVRSVLLACLLTLCACRGDSSAPGDAGSDAPTEIAPVLGGGVVQGTERTWSGLLPCSDCKGIDTRLVLRFKEGRRNYLLTENYLGGGEPNSFNRAGSWSETTQVIDGEAQTIYVLDPASAAEKFAVQPDGALLLLHPDGKPQAEPVAYRLQRL